MKLSFHINCEVKKGTVKKTNQMGTTELGLGREWGSMGNFYTEHTLLCRTYPFSTHIYYIYILFYLNFNRRGNAVVVSFTYVKEFV